MPRRARVIIPNVPHHITQRGVRRRRIFFSTEDYETYKRLLRRWAASSKVVVWAYCLMPNHVHVLAETSRPNGLARTFGGLHSAYARFVNAREQATGHLWQERFFSCAVEPLETSRVARYVLLNPVRAGMVARAEEWPHSSIHGHLGRIADPLIARSPIRNWVRDWHTLLACPSDLIFEEALREHTRRRAPFGSEAFIAELESSAGRSLRIRRPGRPRMYD